MVTVSSLLVTLTHTKRRKPNELQGSKRKKNLNEKRLAISTRISARIKVVVQLILKNSETSRSTWCFLRRLFK